MCMDHSERSHGRESRQKSRGNSTRHVPNPGDCRRHYDPAPSSPLGPLEGFANYRAYPEGRAERYPRSDYPVIESEYGRSHPEHRFHMYASRDYEHGRRRDWHHGLTPKPKLLLEPIVDPGSSVVNTFSRRSGSYRRFGDEPVVIDRASPSRMVGPSSPQMGNALIPPRGPPLVHQGALPPLVFPSIAPDNLDPRFTELHPDVRAPSRPESPLVQTPRHRPDLTADSPSLRPSDRLDELFSYGIPLGAQCHTQIAKSAPLSSPQVGPSQRHSTFVSGTTKWSQTSSEPASKAAPAVLDVPRIPPEQLELIEGMQALEQRITSTEIHGEALLQRQSQIKKEIADLQSRYHQLEETDLDCYPPEVMMLQSFAPSPSKLLQERLEPNTHVVRTVYSENWALAREAAGSVFRVKDPKHVGPGELRQRLQINNERHAKVGAKMMYILICLKKQQHLQQVAEELRYQEQYEQWQQNVEKLEVSLRKKHAKLRTIFEKEFPELKKGVDRSGSKGNLPDYIRSEADMERIMDSLSELEKNKVLVAKIPPLLTKEERTNYHVNLNCFIEDVHSLINEYRSPWSELDQLIFVQKLKETPKDFVAVSEFMQNKTPVQCIDFYYRNKKRLNLKSSAAGNRHGRHRSKSLLCHLPVKPTLTSVVMESVSSSSRAVLRTEQDDDGEDNEGDCSGSEGCEDPVVDSSGDEAGISVSPLPATELSDRVNQLIAKQFAGKTFDAHDPSRWSETEMARAVLGLRKYGRQWGKVSRLVQTKSEAQCKNFYFNYRKKFSLETILGEGKGTSEQEASQKFGGSDIEAATSPLVAARSFMSISTASESHCSHIPVVFEGDTDGYKASNTTVDISAMPKPPTQFRTIMESDHGETYSSDSLAGEPKASSSICVQDNTGVSVYETCPSGASSRHASPTLGALGWSVQTHPMGCQTSTFDSAPAFPRVIPGEPTLSLQRDTGVAHPELSDEGYPPPYKGGNFWEGPTESATESPLQLTAPQFNPVLCPALSSNYETEGMRVLGMQGLPNYDLQTLSEVAFLCSSTHHSTMDTAVLSQLNYTGDQGMKSIGLLPNNYKPVVDQHQLSSPSFTAVLPGSTVEDTVEHEAERLLTEFQTGQLSVAIMTERSIEEYCSLPVVVMVTERPSEDNCLLPVVAMAMESPPEENCSLPVVATATETPPEENYSLPAVTMVTERPPEKDCLDIPPVFVSGNEPYSTTESFPSLPVVKVDTSDITMTIGNQIDHSTDGFFALNPSMEVLSEPCSVPAENPYLIVLTGTHGIDESHAGTLIFDQMPLSLSVVDPKEVSPSGPVSSSCTPDITFSAHLTEFAEGASPGNSILPAPAIHDTLRPAWECSFGSKDDCIILKDVPVVELQNSAVDPSSTSRDPSSCITTPAGVPSPMPPGAGNQECELRLLNKTDECPRIFRPWLDSPWSSVTTEPSRDCTPSDSPITCHILTRSPGSPVVTISVPKPDMDGDHASLTKASEESILSLESSPAWRKQETGPWFTIASPPLTASTGSSSLSSQRVPLQSSPYLDASMQYDLGLPGFTRHSEAKKSFPSPKGRTPTAKYSSSQILQAQPTYGHVMGDGNNALVSPAERRKFTAHFSVTQPGMELTPAMETTLPSPLSEFRSSFQSYYRHEPVTECHGNNRLMDSRRLSPFSPRTLTSLSPVPQTMLDITGQPYFTETRTTSPSSIEFRPSLLTHPGSAVISDLAGHGHFPETGMSLPSPVGFGPVALPYHGGMSSADFPNRTGLRPCIYGSSVHCHGQNPLGVGVGLGTASRSQYSVRSPLTSHIRDADEHRYSSSASPASAVSNRVGPETKLFERTTDWNQSLFVGSHFTGKDPLPSTSWQDRACFHRSAIGAPSGSGQIAPRLSPPSVYPTIVGHPMYLCARQTTQASPQEQHTQLSTSPSILSSSRVSPIFSNVQVSPGSSSSAMGSPITSPNTAVSSDISEPPLGGSVMVSGVNPVTFSHPVVPSNFADDKEEPLPADHSAVDLFCLCDDLERLSGVVNDSPDMRGTSSLSLQSGTESCTSISVDADPGDDFSTHNCASSDSGEEASGTSNQTEPDPEEELSSNGANVDPEEEDSRNDVNINTEEEQVDDSEGATITSLASEGLKVSEHLSEVEADSQDPLDRWKYRKVVSNQSGHCYVCSDSSTSQLLLDAEPISPASTPPDRRTGGSSSAASVMAEGSFRRSPASELDRAAFVESIATMQSYLRYASILGSMALSGSTARRSSPVDQDLAVPQIDRDPQSNDPNASHAIAMTYESLSDDD